MAEPALFHGPVLHMNPKEIPEILDLAQNLLGQWLRYRQFYYKGISKETITPQEEAEFLDISSSIAQNVRKLGQRLDEKKYPYRGSEITGLLKTAISVSHFRNIPAADQKVFYKDWHTTLIYLSRTVGALKFLNEGYRPTVAKPSKGGASGGKQVVAGKAVKGGVKSKGKGGGGSGAMKTVVIVIVLLAAAVGGFFAVRALF